MIYAVNHFDNIVFFAILIIQVRFIIQRYCIKLTVCILPAVLF